MVNTLELGDDIGNRILLLLPYFSFSSNAGMIKIHCHGVHDKIEFRSEQLFHQRYLLGMKPGGGGRGSVSEIRRFWYSCCRRASSALIFSISGILFSR
ncbi:hypothetical protein BG74_05515 [Sodalis-like endosymbiont of Proechinophthirus fluctus]|nr:hypothetical protein BG74_05515 [Sodalis-like endosymbiont of Proechinophthirus fluctus]